MSLDLTISFKHLEHTPALDEAIGRKVKKLEKFFKGPCKINWTSWVENETHRSKVHVYADGHDYHADAASDNLYKTIDMAIHKLEGQIVN